MNRSTCAHRNSVHRALLAPGEGTSSQDMKNPGSIREFYKLSMTLNPASEYPDPISDEAAGREIYTVSRLNREARALLANHFLSIWVDGEISNLACPSSGHLYFMLQPARLFDPGEWSSPCLIALLQHRSMRFTSFSTSYPAAIGGKLQNRSVLQRVNKLI
ncbi:MAG: exodeoxyribonuclease VII large subunit [Methylococcales bacterium]